jgi:L-rhamnose mutarotase
VAIPEVRPLNDHARFEFVAGNRISRLELPSMERYAFKMKLKPGFEAEYKRRHDEIWPELSQALTLAGVSDYSIFLDEETLTLFAVQKLTESNTASGLPQQAIVRRWWDYMSDIMEVNADCSPVCKPLQEVFHHE